MIVLVWCLIIVVPALIYMVVLWSRGDQEQGSEPREQGASPAEGLPVGGPITWKQTSKGGIAASAVLFLIGVVFLVHAMRSRTFPYNAWFGAGMSKDLAAYLQEPGLKHTRGRPYHPMTQGKIERYHRSMKNVVRLENYYTPWALERAVARFVDHYNYQRLHEALGNITPDDMYHGCQHAIVSRREEMKRLTLERRKKENLRNAA